MVAADSNFASVQPAKALEDMRIVLIGVAKQKSCKFPIDHIKFESLLVGDIAVVWFMES